MAKHRIFPEGYTNVTEYINEIGGFANAARILNACDYPVNKDSLLAWRSLGIPLKAYRIFEQVLENREKITLVDTGGSVNVFYNGIALGIFYLAKGIQISFSSNKFQTFKKQEGSGGI
jgi:hypothetical protein